MKDRNPLRLGILDLSARRKGGTDSEALQETIELGKLADQLGYHRFWVSEHHNHPVLSNSSPELLMCHIASVTQKINIGAGGIMLNNYSVLKVAEWMATLNALFPSRIDAGIGRASGADPLATQLLNPAFSADSGQFNEKLLMLMNLLNNGSNDRMVHARPAGQPIDNCWLLSSSGNSAAMATRLQLPVSFSHFMNPEHSAQIVSGCQQEYYQSRSNVAVMVACAESEAEADDLSLSMQYALLQLEKNDPQGILSIDEIKSLPLSLADEQRMAHIKKRILTGTAQSLKTKLEEFATAHNVEELLLITVTYELKGRIRSFELIADGFGLGTITTN